MDSVTLPQLEAAINYWRQRSPSVGDESRLCAEAAALATPYALMIIEGRREMALAEFEDAARAALQAWAATRP
ncbi:MULTISPECIES: DUF3717 domain-containing protein [unclassified Achromobacter]|jgi:hypothetical protein|uniref:DUF3717 domain-containing protein n=1 Tax=unclassified Achromobacter TaxID=2626865 RepID=UPI00069FDD7A|nr:MULTISPECIES: DUF3717 domain-containing protein [unclassified Achromobacter]KOF53901.1 hypothetical protein AD428_10500 [Achromobacter sp. DMS1]